MNVRFLNNTASIHGGAVMLESVASARLDACMFSGNTAGREGGALAIDSTISASNVEFQNSTVEGTVVGHGGAVHASRSSRLHTENVLILGTKGVAAVSLTAAIASFSSINVQQTTGHGFMHIKLPDT